ncbi:hypothetical protein SVIOM342S_07942 [Streptomyces violaceorubidus]
MTMFLIVLKLACGGPAAAAPERARGTLLRKTGLTGLAGLLREARLPLGVGVLPLGLLRSLRLVLRERVALRRRLGGHWGIP